MATYDIKEGCKSLKDLADKLAASKYKPAIADGWAEYDATLFDQFKEEFKQFRLNGSQLPAYFQNELQQMVKAMTQIQQTAKKYGKVYRIPNGLLRPIYTNLTKISADLSPKSSGRMGGRSGRAGHTYF